MIDNPSKNILEISRGPSFFGSFIGYCLARVEPPTSQIANKGHIVHLGDLGIQINEPKSIKA